MTEKEYRNHPAISRSALWHIKESPEKFRYYQDFPQASTPALVFGQFFHAMALQPEIVDVDFALAPSVDRRTKDGREMWKQFAEENSGKSIVTNEMVAQASAMCAKLHENPFARKLMEGEKEVPHFWVDEITGEECKCRSDVLTTIGDINIIVDLKTTENAETDAFVRSSIKYGYDFQAAMYLEGLKATTGKDWSFVFIAIEKNPPYSINILQADELFIRRGYDIFRELIGIYHDCKQTGNWYGYLGKFDQINALGLPEWLRKNVE